jgi:hypothetical protein
MRHFLQFREASLKRMHILEEENASLRAQLQLAKTKIGLQQQPGSVEKTQDLEKRLDDLKMSYDQQILDLQVGSVICDAVQFLPSFVFRSITPSKAIVHLHKV